MNTTDWLGFVGVAILLAAYFMNLTNRLSKDSLAYIAMNLFGAALACIASLLIHYLPFVVLEGAWTLVSLFSLYQYFFGKKAL